MHSGDGGDCAMSAARRRSTSGPMSPGSTIDTPPYGISSTMESSLRTVVRTGAVSGGFQTRTRASEEAALNALA
jgi:hypothetical protein